MLPQHLVCASASCAHTLLGCAWDSVVSSSLPCRSAVRQTSGCSSTGYHTHPIDAVLLFPAAAPSMNTTSLTPPGVVRKKTLGVRRRLPTAAAPLLSRLSSSTVHPPLRHASVPVRRASRSVSPPPLVAPPSQTSQPSMEDALASISSSLDSFDASAASSVPNSSEGDDAALASPIPAKRGPGRPPRAAPSTPSARTAPPPRSNGVSHPPTFSPLLNAAGPAQGTGRSRGSTSTPKRPASDSLSPSPLRPSPSQSSGRRRRRRGEEEESDEEKSAREEKELDDLIDGLDKNSDVGEEEHIQPETQSVPAPHSNGAVKRETAMEDVPVVKRKRRPPKKMKEEVPPVEAPARKVGRPRKSQPPQPLPTTASANGVPGDAPVEPPVRRKIGRPRKVQPPAPAISAAGFTSSSLEEQVAVPSSSTPSANAPTVVGQEAAAAAAQPIKPTAPSPSSSSAPPPAKLAKSAARPPPPAKAAAAAGLPPALRGGVMSRPPPEVMEAPKPQIAKGGKRGAVVVDDQRIRDINRVLRDLRQLGRPWTAEQLRRLVHVSPLFGTAIKVEFELNGELTPDRWTAVVMACREERRLDKEEHMKKKMAKSQEDGDFKDWSKSSKASKGKSTANGEVKEKKQKKQKAEREETDKDDQLVNGSRYLKGKAKKKRKKEGGEGDEEDFEEVLAQEAVQQRMHSLRQRRKVDYSAQLVDDPLTIVDLTWYPTKASQPFRVLIDPIIPVILDVHSHLADTEVIGVLSGEWLPAQSLLILHSAYPCHSLATDNDLVNVEIDPTSLVEASSRIEQLGSHIVGWYHSHPYFRNQPSLVDVENQRKYQEMFRGGGGEMGGSPFIGAIVTPYGQEGFKPLPSNVKWFFHKEGKGRGGGDGAGLGSGDYDGGGTPMELWTDVGMDEERDRKVEGHGEVVARLLDLCGQYGSHPRRVDFKEEWQAGEGRDGDEEGVAGSQSSVSSPSGMSPKGRRRTADEVKAISCKLDQFRASLAQHCELMDRWDGKAKRQLVERVIDAVSQWKGRGSTQVKKGRKSQARHRHSEEEDDEDETEDDDDGEDDEEEEDEYKDRRSRHKAEAKGSSSEEF